MINSILHIEFDELVSSGISPETIKKARYRGSSSWKFRKDPADARKVLVEFDSLRPAYRKAIEKSLCGGAPIYIWYRQQQDEALKQQLNAAREALKQHLSVDPEHVARAKEAGLNATDAWKLARLAAMCELYNRITRTSIREIGFRKKAELLESLYEIAHTEELPVPKNRRRFQDKFSAYRRSGIRGLMSRKRGNRNRAKLNEEQASVLLYIYSRPNNYNLVRTTDEYNRMAEKAGWPTLSLSTVKRYLGRPDVRQTAQLGRNGFGHWRNQYDITVHRARPSRPCMLWVEDVWTFELYYQKSVAKDGGRRTMHWLRKKVSIVIDAYNDIILGYAIGDQETAEMKREAWKMAVQNAGYFPAELKSDRWKSGEIDELYYRMAAHVRLSAVGNARDKVIEPMFNRLNEAVLKDFPNWAGKNVTSRGINSVVNREHLERIKHSFPTEEEVMQQIRYCIMKWNTMPRKSGEPLAAAWKAGDFSQARKADLPGLIECFGQRHTHTHTLRKEGLTVSIDGVKHIYRLNSSPFISLIGAQFQVMYLPDDLSAVVAEDQYGKQWVVPAEGAAPMALGDRVDGDGAFINSRLEFKKEHFRHHAERLQQAESKAMELGVYDEINALGAGRHYLTENGHAKEMAAIMEEETKTITRQRTLPSSLYDTDDADCGIIE